MLRELNLGSTGWPTLASRVTDSGALLASGQPCESSAGSACRQNQEALRSWPWLVLLFVGGTALHELLLPVCY